MILLISCSLLSALSDLRPKHYCLEGLLQDVQRSVPIQIGVGNLQLEVVPRLALPLEQVPFLDAAQQMYNRMPSVVHGPWSTHSLLLAKENRTPIMGASRTSVAGHFP